MVKLLDHCWCAQAHTSLLHKLSLATMADLADAGLSFDARVVNICGVEVQRTWSVTSSRQPKVIQTKEYDDHTVFDFTPSYYPAWLKNLVGGENNHDKGMAALSHVLDRLRAKVAEARGHRTKACKLVSKDGSIQGSSLTFELDSHEITLANHAQHVRILATRTSCAFAWEPV